MQSKLLGVSVLIVALVASILLWQRQQASEARARLVETEKALQTAAAKQEEAAKKLEEMEQQRSNLQGQLTDLAGESATLRASIVEAKSKPPAEVPPDDTETKGDSSGGLFKKGMAGMMQKMMKDPAMKELMVAQQKASINTMYGSLFKDLNLSAEEQEKFVDMMVNSQSAALENADAFFGGDAASRTNLAATLGEKQKILQEEMRAFLGEERFAQYQEYQGSIGERMQLDQFKSKLAGTDMALQEEQTKQLLQLMKEERTKVPPAFSGNDQESTKDFAKMMSGDVMEKQLKWQEDLNRRILDGSTEILSEDQLKQLKALQEQQINMQRLGIKMAKEMFNSEAAETNSATPE